MPFVSLQIDKTRHVDENVSFNAHAKSARVKKPKRAVLTSKT